jgi:hypothetical protein
LNVRGLEDFRIRLESMRAGVEASGLDQLLEVGEFAVPCEDLPAIELGVQFPTRMELGRHLCSAFGDQTRMGARYSDVGLWTWLSVAWFDQICPTSRGGHRAPNADAMYILNMDFKRQYRHLIRSAFIAYSIHGDNARIVLSGPPDTHGEAAEMILSRQELLTNKGLFEAMCELYLRRDGRGSWSFARGARSKNVGGTTRRLGKVLKQYDLTYDMSAMTGQEILKLLPKEFSRFKSSET